MELLYPFSVGKCMTNMKAFVVQWLNAPPEARLARRFPGLWTECGVKQFKGVVIRPSTLFSHSRHVLFHSTSNYYNPVISQRAPGLTVPEMLAAGETNVSGGVDTSAATGDSSACLPPPDLCSSGLCELHWLYCAKNKMSRDCLLYSHFSISVWRTWYFLVASMKVLVYFPGQSTQSCTLFFS